MTGAHETHGAIRDEWSRLGWERSAVGYPITDETGTPDGVGRYNHFQYGSVYWTPRTGAHEIHGAIRDEWARLGWERSVVGYPTTDETGTPDRVSRFNHFQYGSVYWTPQTGAHEIHGAIHAEWARLGWERSPLGYPITDETDIGGHIGRFNHFQCGTIYWTPSTGTSDLVFQDRAFAAMEQWVAPFGLLDRRTMLTLFSNIESNGVVSRTEFASLRALLAAPSYVMPDYVQILARKVINGDRANEHFQGRDLGNLHEGSSARQLDLLVQKWFIGIDHPAIGSGYTYHMASGTLFGSGLSHLDINQGYVGDCYFVASLESVALHSPDMIRQMIIDNGDHTYTIRFFHDSRPDYVTVDLCLPTQSNGYFAYDYIGHRFDDSANKLWGALIEKAYAQLAESGWSRDSSRNAYSSLDGGWPNDALATLTGRPRDEFRPDWWWLFGSGTYGTDDINRIESAFRSNQNVVACTRHGDIFTGSVTTTQLINAHCYCVTGISYNTRTRAYEVSLRNPWGRDSSDSFTVSWDVFRRSMDDYVIC
jgi:hypothetical protein